MIVVRERMRVAEELSRRMEWYLGGQRGVRGGTRRTQRWALGALLMAWQDGVTWGAVVEGAEKEGRRRGWTDSTVRQARRVWERFARWHDIRYATLWVTSDGAFRARILHSQRWNLTVRQRQRVVMMTCLWGGWTVKEVQTAKMEAGSWPLTARWAQPGIVGWWRLRRELQRDLTAARKVGVHRSWVESELLFPGPRGHPLHLSGVRLLASPREARRLIFGVAADT